MITKETTLLFPFFRLRTVVKKVYLTFEKGNLNFELICLGKYNQMNLS